MIYLFFYRPADDCHQPLLTYCRYAIHQPNSNLIVDTVLPCCSCCHTQFLITPPGVRKYELLWFAACRDVFCLIACVLFPSPARQYYPHHVSDPLKSQVETYGTSAYYLLLQYTPALQPLSGYRRQQDAEIEMWWANGRRLFLELAYAFLIFFKLQSHMRTGDCFIFHCELHPHTGRETNLGYTTSVNFTPSSFGLGDQPGILV